MAKKKAKEETCMYKLPEFTCRYCEKTFPGEAEYCIPEDFPINAALGGLPLCETCGGSPTPTLEEICGKLDKALAIKDILQSNAQTTRIALLTYTAEERMIILDGTGICLQCGEDREGRGPCTCRRDE
jgi:hypothetical protein